MGSRDKGFKGYDTMVRIVGKRHATCWFDNYDIGDDEHTEERRYALDRAVEFAKALKDDAKSGKNIIFTGTCGTGKDHLAVSILRAALSYSMSARFFRGSVLCNECRRHSLENSQDVPYDIWTTDLLVISDIEPHRDKKATEFEQRALLELIDRRYTAMTPIVVTTNKESREALSATIGESSVDRLFHGAVIVPMAWPSGRD